MPMPAFLQRLMPGAFAVRSPKIDQVPPAPPRGEQAVSAGSLALLLGGRLLPYNPDELKAWKGIDIYRRMLRDPQVKAAFNLITSIILSRNWRFEAQDDDPRQAEIADFFTFTLEQALRGTFRQAMRAILLAKANGVSVSEKVYETVEFNGATRWALRALKPKPVDTFQFEVDAFGNLTGLSQQQNARRVKLDPRKFVFHVNHPELDEVWGESDLRAVYRAYWRKDIIQRFWDIYLERMAGGFLVAMVDDKAGAIGSGEETDLKNILSNPSGTTGIIMPAGYKLEVELPGTTDAYEKAVTHCDMQIGRGLMLSGLLGFSPQPHVGSLAAAKPQFRAFMTVVMEEGDAVADTLNEQVFPELALWNFGETRPPLFRFDRYTDEDKLEIAKQWINAINNQAVLGTLEDENRLRELMDFDERDPAEEVITRGRNVPQPPPAGGNPQNSPPGPTDPPPPEPDVQAAARFADHRTPPWQRRIDFPALAKRLDALEAAYRDELAGAVDSAWQGVQRVLRDFLGSEQKPQPDDATRIASESVPPEARRQLQGAVAGHLQAAYDFGRRTAQGELDDAAGAAPLAMAQRLRFAIGQARQVAVRCRRDAPEYIWGVAEFVQGVRLDTAAAYFRARGFQISGDISEAIRKAVEQVLLGAITEGKSIREVVAELEPLLKDVIGEYDAAGRRINLGARLSTIARTTLAEAFNQAQLAVYTDPDVGDFVQAFEYSAVLDSRTTPFCRAYDGRVVLKSDPIWSRIVPPNHFNCRSRLIPVTAVDDFQPDGALPVEPAPGFGGTS